MNKRLIASILILLLVLTLTIVSYAMICRRFIALREAVRGAVYAEAPDPELIRRIEKESERSEWIFSLMLDRRDLLLLYTQLHELTLQQDDKDAFRSGCIHALRLLEELEKSQRFTLKNILEIKKAAEP